MRVLIVDDNEVELELLHTTLRSAGYEVEMARDGCEALDMLRRSPIRLVVSDWAMPRMSGIDLCRQVRKSDLSGYVYFIVLTAYESPTQAVEGLTAGADDFVRKPYHPAELLARVRAGERVLALETREIAIFALAKLAESRDIETGLHLERVRSYSKLLAIRLAESRVFGDQIDDEFIRLIYLTSPLHDIGKVGIPDSVLLKPGRLSDGEFEIMKTHTTVGAKTLDAAVRMFPGVKFLQMARDIALNHHERFDGRGYPAGLQGEQIPLAARIVALADVYDALSSKRVYKNAFSHDVAREIIVKERGTQFDPNVVDAFIQAEPQFIEIRERFAESTGDAMAA